MFQILLVISSFVSLSYSVSDCNGHESKYFVTCYTVPDVPLNHIIPLISANGSVRIYTIPFCKNGSSWTGHQSWVDVFSIHLKLLEIAKNAPHSLCTIFLDKPCGLMDQTASAGCTAHQDVAVALALCEQLLCQRATKSCYSPLSIL